MTVSFPDLFAWLHQVAFSHLRVSAFFLFAPILGLMALSLQIRLVITTLVAIAMTGLVEFPRYDALAPLTQFLTAGREVVLGAALGLLLRALFAAASTAGEVMAAAMGLSVAAMVDPASGENNPLIAQLLNQLLMLAFLSVHGPVALIALLFRSYDAWPPAPEALPDGLLMAVLGSVGEMLVDALVLMSPVVMVVLLINAALGVLNRLAPQMNMFSIGAPTALLGGLLALGLFLPDFGHKLATITTEALDAVASVLGGGRPS